MRIIAITLTPAVVIPVLFIDNANILPMEQLSQLQDYAKASFDKGVAKLCLWQSEGSVSRHMIGKSILCINCLYAD